MSCVAKGLHGTIADLNLLETTKKTEKELITELRKAGRFGHQEKYFELLGLTPSGLTRDEAKEVKILVEKTLMYAIVYGVMGLDIKLDNNNGLGIFSKVVKFGLLPAELFILNCKNFSNTNKIPILNLISACSGHCSSGWVEICKILFSIRSIHYSVCASAHYALKTAINVKCFELVKILCNENFVDYRLLKDRGLKDVEWVCGGTLLGYTLKHGNVEIVEHFLKHGIVVTRRDICFACRKGDLKIVKLLVAWGDVDFGACEVAVAERFGHEEVVNFLKDMMIKKKESGFVRYLRCFRRDILL